MKLPRWTQSMLAKSRSSHSADDVNEPAALAWSAAGWPDQNYFARRFKAHYGLSATTYRSRFATRAAHLHSPGADGLGSDC